MSRIIFKINIFAILIGVGFSLVSCNRAVKSNDKPNKPVVLQSNENAGIYGGLFSIPEIEIVLSPDTACGYIFSEEEQIVDYSVSPAGSLVAVLVEQNKQHELKFWEIGTSELLEGCPMPKDFKAETIAWHPQASALFVLGTQNTESMVYRVEKANEDWAMEPIFSSSQKLKNMTVCPQPFIIEYDYKHYSYRLFLGMDNGNNTYRIVSITEHGQQFYQVVGPEKTQTIYDYETPSTMNAAWALPVTFHPAGHQLIWKDQNNNYFVATYKGDIWGKSTPTKLPLKNKESVIPTPNGLGMISWAKNTDGIEMYLISEQSISRQLTEYQFETAPVSVPDGRGIVGKTVNKGVNTLHYTPVNIPLHNVLNAWLFINSVEELDLFQKQYGLFRSTNYEQLYELYESENYSRNYPARPYLVTTDIFWEIFGAAYQGVFIIKEREQAIPNFWKFIDEADNYFKINHKESKWNIVFTALKDLKTNNKTNREALRITNEDDDISEVTQTFYAYSDLKPRGHYTSSPEMELYFRAFRYFTTILSEDQDVLTELEDLPAEISQYAIHWINSYSEFIAPSRSSLVWKNLKTEIPQYCQYPNRNKALFPLSWGFDNEVFYSVVYHQDWADDMRIQGAPDKSGFVSDDKKRFLPSGLDIAVVLGNGFAENLMTDEYAKYPPLRKMITNLRANHETHSDTPDFKTNLYNQWINAMAVQWADSVNPVGDNGKEIWQAKRLQTGLATWATLRHATVLVNERSAAECGEGGFEEMIMKSPRGCVEADPYTFGAIADLFEELLKMTSKFNTNAADKQAVYTGLAQRLKEAKEETLLFAAMAEKERNGETLTDEEYEKILWVARVAEHLFLVFRSLEDDQYGLSVPDPIGKITDVAQANWARGFGQGVFSYLMVAVGNPMEWNYIVPYCGRYQVVKGSIYSYYEFESKELLNDEEWRQGINKQAVLSWVKPYITSSPASKANTNY